jgi:hypothetical protein
MPISPLNRRTFLRSAGVGIGLPLLDAMLPVGPGADQKADRLRPKRLLLIGRPLGLYTPYFFPDKPGKDYEPSRYLRPLQDHRDHFTVFSGMSHLGYPGGHHTENCLLTAVPPERARFGDIRNTISLDQEAAARIGGETRFPSLSLGGGGTGALSWNAKGVRVPSEERATQVFKQLFLDGTPDEIARELRRIEAGQSILDGVRDQAKALAADLGPGDRERLDLLLTSIREAEQRLQQDQAWARRPRPKVAVKPFAEDHLSDLRTLDRERQWFDLVHLALQTDSTRVIALWVWSYGRIDLEGVAIGHHDATHHGQDEAKIKQLALIEEAEMRLFAGLLSKMRATDEGGPSLLDRTVVFYGSNLGNGSAHTCENLPTLVAGGGLKHAGYVAFERKENRDTRPLANLFVRMLHQVGIERESFGTSTGALTEV